MGSYIKNTTMKKKICFILPKYQADDATHFSYIIELVTALKRDWDVFLFLEKGNVPDFFPHGYFYLQRFNFLPLRWLENFLVILWIRLRGYRDFYIHYSFLSAFNASWAVKFLGGRTFYWNCGFPWLYKRNFLRQGFESFVYKLITFLVTGTPSLRKKYAEYYRLLPEKIKILPNGISLSRFYSNKDKVQQLRKRLNLPEGFRVILFVHHLSRRKGALVLPQIAALLKEEKAILVIVGDGPERKNVELKVKSCTSKARFLGWVPNRDLPDYYALADVFILPSEEEGFPHVILETMAMGVPFAAFDVGGVKEIVPSEFFKYVIPGGNLDVFVERIRELLYADSKSREFLKQSELQWVRQFDVKFIVERFNQLLNQ